MRFASFPTCCASSRGSPGTRACHEACDGGWSDWACTWPCPSTSSPNFTPVLGYADDAIVAAFVLRSVARRAGPEAIVLHWPGTEAALLTLLALLHLPSPDSKPSA
jgi:hypothetical protein